GQLVHDLAADDVHWYARGGDRGDQVTMPGPGGHGHEQVGDLCPAMKSVRHRLRAFGEEGPLTLAEGSFVQASRGSYWPRGGDPPGTPRMPAAVPAVVSRVRGGVAPREPRDVPRHLGGRRPGCVGKCLLRHL